MVDRVDNISKIENAIIRQTAMTDSLINEVNDLVQELIFDNLDLRAYLLNPQEEIRRLVNIIVPVIVEAFPEAMENGINLADQIERSLAG